MIPTTNHTVLGERVREAIEHLPAEVAGEFPTRIRELVASNMTVQGVETALARLHAVARDNAAYAPRGHDRAPSGKPLPRINAQYHIVAYTDCTGPGDPETTGRIAVEEFGRLERLGVSGQRLNWLQTEPLSPIALEASITSSYYTHILRQEREPGYQGQLVILGNSAPRSPENPSAKGCPFVLARLVGEVWYLGTLNEGGPELEAIKSHVMEIWRTTLGVEKEGTADGKRPKAVFRSQHLLALFEGLATGNESLLVEKMDVDTSIEASNIVRTRNSDSFGNIKLDTAFDRIRNDHRVEFGDRLNLVIGNGVGGRASVTATVARSHGDGVAEELLLVPGSSPLGRDSTRADLVVNGGSALQLLASNGLDFKSVAVAGRPIAFSRERSLEIPQRL